MIASILTRSIPNNENWFFDTKESFTEIGVETDESFKSVKQALEANGIEYTVHNAENNILRIYER